MLSTVWELSYIQSAHKMAQSLPPKSNGVYYSTKGPSVERGEDWGALGILAEGRCKQNPCVFAPRLLGSLKYQMWVSLPQAVIRICSPCKGQWTTKVCIASTFLPGYSSKHRNELITSPKRALMANQLASMKQHICHHCAVCKILF